MANNDTQIVITARDEASAVLNRISGSFEAMKAPISSLQGAVAGLGTAFAGLSVVTSIKGALTMADEIGKLAQKTGVTVESFSKLSYAAKLSDVSNEQLATSLKKLSQNMTDAAAGTGEAQKYFKALGVSVTDGAGKLKSADAVMGELAGRFAGMEDGATKTATAMAIFGKSGADLIPMLNAGSGGLESMADEAQRLGLVMSDDMVKGAEQFNDNLTRLSAAANGLSVTIGNQMLPGLTSVTSAMVEAAKEGGLLQSVWVGLGGLGAALFTDEFASPAKKIKNLQQDIMDMQRHLPDVQGGGLLQKWMYGSEAELNAGINNARNQIKAIEQEMANAAKAGDEAARKRSESEKKRAEETEARLRKLLEGGKTSSTAARESDYSKLNAQISERIALLTAEATAGAKLTEGEKLSAKIEQDLASGKIKLSATQRALLSDTLEMLTAKEKEAIESERQRKGVEALAEAEKKRTQALADAVEKDQQTLDALTIKNDLLAQGIDSQAAYNVALLEAEMASMDFATATWEEIEALEKRLAIAKKIATEDARGEGYKAQKKAAEDAARDWQKSSEEINRALTDALMRGFESGKGFAENLRDATVNMFKTMVLRPVISAVLSPVSGAITTGMAGMGFGGTANAAGGALNFAGSASNAWNWFNGTNDLAAGFMGSSFGQSIGLTTPFVDAAAEFAGAVPGLTSFTEAGASLSGSLSALGSALPYLGVALAGLSLFGVFDHKGGPKVGSSSYVDQFGTLQAGEYNGETFNRTSSGGDPFKIQDMTKGLVKDLSGVAGMFGTSLGEEFRFGLQAEFDPEGTAPGTVGYMVGGKTVTKQMEGADVEGGAKELGVMAQRAMIDALSQLDLSPVVDPLLDSITDIGALSEAEAQQVLATVTQLAGMSTDQVEAIFGEALDVSKLSAMSLSGETTIATFARLAETFTATNAVADMLGQDVSTAFGEIGLASADMRQALIDGAGGLDKFTAQAQGYYNAFFTDAEKQAKIAANATAELEATFGSLGLAIPETHQEFNALLSSLEFSTEAGQSTYQMLMDVTDAFVALHGTAQDAAGALQDASAALQNSAGATESWVEKQRNIQAGTNVQGGPGWTTIEDMVKSFIESNSTHISGVYSGPEAIQAQEEQLKRMIDDLQLALPKAIERESHGGVWSGMNTAAALKEQIDLYNKALAELAVAQEYGGHGLEIRDLEKWYEQEKAYFTRNKLDLIKLEEVYQAKRLEIINGGNESASAALSGWQEKLRGWLDALAFNNQLSPLTAQQQFAEAQQQYMENLALANTGDQDALAAYQQYAQEYLSQAKNMYGFGGEYSAIWNAIQNQGETFLAPPPVDPNDRTVVAIEDLAAQVDEMKIVLARLTERGNAQSEEQTKTIVAAIRESGNAQASATKTAAAVKARA